MTRFSTIVYTCNAKILLNNRMLDLGVLLRVYTIPTICGRNSGGMDSMVERGDEESIPVSVIRKLFSTIASINFVLQSTFSSTKVAAFFCSCSTSSLFIPEPS